MDVAAPPAIPTRTPRPAAAERPPAVTAQALPVRAGAAGVFAIARRDLKALIVSPVGWGVAAVFTFLASSFGFDISVLGPQQATMSGVYGVITDFLVPVTIPLLTARLFVGETSSGRPWQLTAGKWLAAFAVYLLLLATTLIYLALLLMRAGTLDLGLAAATYVGMVLSGAAAIAIGVLASTVARNPFIALGLAVAGALTVWYGGYLIAPWVVPPASSFFQSIAGYNRLQPFALGAVALRDIVFFVTIAAGALFLSTRVVSRRRPGAAA